MLIAHGKAFKPTQRNAVERMLSSASSEVWKVEDLSSMLKTIEAINASACARRGAQKFGYNFLQYFTEEQWTRLKNCGVPCLQESAETLFQKIKILGGKNLDEHSKKNMAAIWLFSRGDARALGFGGRSVAYETFKKMYSRSFRSFEPTTYVHELPNVQGHQELYADQYTLAFPGEGPKNIPQQDHLEIQLIDNMLNCRGNVGRFEASEQLQVRSPPWQDQQQMFAQRMAAMQQYVQMCQQMSGSRNDDEAHIEFFPPTMRGAGRPLRCVSFNQNERALPALTEKVEQSPSASDKSAPGDVAAEAEPDGPKKGRSVEKSSAADDLRKVAESMLARGKKREKDPNSIESDEDERPPIKAMKVMKAMKKSGAKTPAEKDKKKPATKKETKTKKSLEWPKKPLITWENSREQVMCRTGKGGPGSSLAIRFKEAGGAKKAWTRAEKWLEKTMKEYASFTKA